MTKPEKNFDTGLRILEVLKILMVDNAAKDEMIEKLKETSDFADVYTYEAFIKYFNTFEASGLKIEKKKNKYALKNAVVTTDLSGKEKNLLQKLINFIGKLNNVSVENTIKNFFSRFGKFVDIDLTEYIEEAQRKANEEYSANIKNNIVLTLKKMLYEKQIVNITYKKNNQEITVTVELKDITEKGSNIYAVCYDKSEGCNYKINISSIVSIKQMPQQISGMNYLKSVVFELYGRLASSYKLKKSEKALNFGANYITVSNSEEDRDILLHRLLKYGEYCKIIKPQEVKEEFLNMTNEMLRKLES